jgi:hypothetical protein
MHEARFMADCIYLLSMELFSKEFMKDNILATRVHKMAVFVAVWNGPNFLKFGLTVSAPATDLDYFFEMMKLSYVTDPDFSRIGVNVTESFQRHTSYLNPPQVIFGNLINI